MFENKIKNRNKKGYIEIIQMNFNNTLKLSGKKLKKIIKYFKIGLV